MRKLMRVSSPESRLPTPKQITRFKSPVFSEAEDETTTTNARQQDHPGDLYTAPVVDAIAFDAQTTTGLTPSNHRAFGRVHTRGSEDYLQASELVQNRDPAIRGLRSN